MGMHHDHDLHTDYATIEIIHHDLDLIYLLCHYRDIHYDQDLYIDYAT